MIEGFKKIIGITLTSSIVVGFCLCLFIWYGSYSEKLDQEMAAIDAVFDYNNNKVSIGYDLRDTDPILAKPSDSESCPSEGRFWVGFRSHSCWIVEHPTKEKTYRWFVDLRNPEKVQRKGFDHKKQEWVDVEVYEHRVESLPSVYPHSH